MKTSMGKRVLSVFVALAMLLGLMSTGAYAQANVSSENNITYIDYNKSTNQFVSETKDSATVITSEITELTSGWYVTSGSETTISSCVTVSGDVHLILKDGCTLNCEKGIDVSGDNSLTIYGQSDGSGTLNAEGQSGESGGYPGIGGGENKNVGTIVINGGIINANGSFDNEYVYPTTRAYLGAGIGGGSRTTGGGSVLINGGQVTANGASGWSKGSARSIQGIVADSFSTGANGNALIKTNYGITDKSQQDEWSGIIFEGNSGAVYGEQTLAADFAIQSDNTLTISSDAKLTIPQGRSFTNSGTLNLAGGDLECNGSLTNNGTLNVESGSKLTVSEMLISSGTTEIEGEAQCKSIQNSGTMTISGKFTCNGGTNTGLIYNVGTFTNNGMISGENGYVVSTTHVDGVGNQLITRNNIFYLNEDGNKTYLTDDDVICPLTADDHTWGKQFEKNTWYFAIKDLTIDDGVKLEDDVNLILMDDVTLTINGKNGNGGINAENHTLNIYAQSCGDKMGTLKATAGQYNWMAIGGSNANININGGFIEAGLTGEWFSGIGASKYCNFGKLTITGGIVKTTSIGAEKVGDLTGGLSAPEGSSAVIYTQQTKVDSSKVSDFNGIIFLNKNGSVYGNAKLASDLTVNADETLTIPSGTTLTIPEGITLTINGKLDIKGTLVVEGTLVNSGTISKASGSGSVTMDDWTYGEAANTPKVSSTTNGTKNVTYRYKVKDATEYLAGIPTDAGEYTVEATFAATDIYDEYTATADFVIKQKTLNLTVKVKDKIYDGLDTATIDGTPALNGVEENDNLTLTNGKPTFSSTAVGTNIPINFTEFSISGDAASNYTLTQPSGVTANITAYTATGREYATTTKDWTNQDFVVTANEGWQVSETNTADGTWSGSLTCTAETGSTSGRLTFYVKNTTSGIISEAVTEQYKIDKTAPEGKIQIDERNVWQEFVNTISFNLFYKNEQTVTVTANDAGSSVKTIEYLVTEDDLNIEQLANKTFTSYNGAFGIEPDAKLIVYAKLTDNVGNVTYLRSDGVVLDATAPVINGAENGKTYCTAVTLTITDDYLDSVTLNNAVVTLTDGKLTLESADGTQTVVTTDKAGNSASITVTINDGHTWGDWTSNGNGTHTHTCQLDAAHTETGGCHGGKATCKNKAVCEICGEEYGELAPHELTHIDAKASTAAEVGNTEYWKCTVCDKYFSDENAANEAKPEDTVIAKLAPTSIAGDGAAVTQGEKKALSFTSDAAFEDFLRVEVDGKTVDASHYTVRSGSTIVTLNADYVASLAVGEHTLSIVSKSGTAEAKFTVNKKTAEVTDNNKKSSQTGDTSNLALWLALLLTSGGAVIGTTAVSRKKKYNK